MVVLLPLDDAPCMEKQQQAPSQQPRGQQAQQGQHGSHTLQVHGQARCRGGAALPPSSPLPSQQQQQLSSQPTWQWPPTPSALPYPLPTAQPSPRPLIAASAHHYGTQGGTGKLAARPAYAGLQQGQLQGQQPPMGAGVTWFRYYVPGTSSSSTSEASGTADGPAGAAATPGQHGRSRAYDAAAPGAAGAQPEAQAVAGAVQARRGFWGDGLSAELWGAVHDLYGPSMLQALKAAVKG